MRNQISNLHSEMDSQRAWERQQDFEVLRNAFSSITDELNDLSKPKTLQQLEVLKKRLEHMQSVMESNLITDVAEGKKEQEVLAQQTELREKISRAIDANLKLIDDNKNIKVAGYRLNTRQLLKLGELLAKGGFIRKTDVKLFSKMQGGMQWNNEKKTPRLIYLIGKIREDGKCPYAKMSRIFSVTLKSNTRVKGYSDIDDLINLATI